MWVWHADGDVCTAAGLVRGCGDSSVGLRDGGDDREPEPGSAAASTLVGAAEALEGARCEGDWEASAFVGHVQVQPVAVLLGGHPDCAGAVAEGILDQVAKRLLDPESVDAGTAAAVAFDCPVGFSGATFEPHCHAVEEFVQADFVPSDREGSFVQSREQQEVFGQLREAVAFDLLPA